MSKGGGLSPAGASRLQLRRGGIFPPGARRIGDGDASLGGPLPGIIPAPGDVTLSMGTISVPISMDDMVPVEDFALGMETIEVAVEMQDATLTEDAGAWTPALLANLIAWYKADSGVFSDLGGTTPATDGQAVARWDDNSGHGYHYLQATSGLRPIFGASAMGSGKPGLIADLNAGTVMFTAAGVAMGTGNLASGFFVAQLTANPTAFGRVFGYVGGADGTDSDTDSVIFGLQYPGNPDVSAYRGGTIIGPGTAVANTTFQFGAVFDGTDATVYLNNTEAASEAINMNFSDAGLIELFSNYNFGSAGGNTWDGAIGEIVLTNGAMSSDDRASLATYFSGRW